MTVRVVYKPDKSVVVIYPAPKSRRPDETEEDWLKRVFDKAMRTDLKGLPFDDMDISEVPPNRKDRGAWEGEKGKGISINPVKAEEQRKEREKEEKIGVKLREMAIKELEKDGEL